ncbi:hypothetical protein OF83DRAFT_1054989 [Amylostereum chailletii]|nr:hypothetical protein OF83DRAFT_1054989 [Amylostereum chailletii]
MPLHVASASTSPASLTAIKEQYVIFYASRDESGRMWCGDCRDVEHLVERTFDGSDAPSALIVYVGHKPEWKTPSNPFRAEPWLVQSIPTVVRTTDNARLVEGEIGMLLEQFIKPLQS